MVLGYRAADGAVYWGRAPMWVGINNLLMSARLLFLRGERREGCENLAGH